MVLLPKDPLCCLKWLWDVHQNCDIFILEAPWALKSQQILDHSLSNSNWISKSSYLSYKNPSNWMLKYVKVVVSRWKKERMLVPEEEGEMEHKALASALVRKNMLWLLSSIHPSACFAIPYWILYWK